MYIYVFTLFYKHLYVIMGAHLKSKHLGGLFCKHYKDLLDFPTYLIILIILLNFWQIIQFILIYITIRNRIMKIKNELTKPWAVQLLYFRQLFKNELTRPKAVQLFY